MQDIWVHLTKLVSSVGGLKCTKGIYLNLNKRVQAS